ncbi:hypothetical protein D3C87_1294650 [compost metagenome]
MSDVESVIGWLGDLAASQQRGHAGQQFQGAQWLDDVVIGAGAQPLHQIVFRRPVGQENDGDAGTDIGAQPAYDIVAIDIWQMPIQQHQIKVLRAQRSQQITALVIAGAGVSRGSQHLVDAPGLVKVVFQRRNLHQKSLAEVCCASSPSATYCKGGRICVNE